MKIQFIFSDGNGKKKFSFSVPDISGAVGSAARGAARLGAAAYGTAADILRPVTELVQSVKDEIREDIAAVRQRDPAAKSDIEVLLLYSGVHAILAYRVAHKLYLGKKYFSARAVSQLARHFTGIEIHPGARIGKGLFIDHGAGVVIGETSEIGDNCTLYQGVTLGGTGKDCGKRHPTLGNNVMVGAGAKVLGPFKIGDNSKIAAGAVVLNAIPENSTAVGIPAKVVRRGGVRVSGEDVIAQELDHVHVPDPVGQQIAELRGKLDTLTEQLDRMSGKNADRTASPASGSDPVPVEE